jgi:hypothetical protein
MVLLDLGSVSSSVHDTLSTSPVLAATRGAPSAFTVFPAAAGPDTPVPITNAVAVRNPFPRDDNRRGCTADDVD